MDGAPFLLLAVDHRTSAVRGLFGGDAEAAARALPEAKLLVLDGLRRARARLGAERPGRLGVLVDDEFGTRAARAARADGLLVALAIERSGQAAFALEHGDAFTERLAAVDPHLAKVLVRLNPGGDAERDARQLETLAAVSRGLAEAEVPLMFELLVPPTAAQLAAAGGAQERFDAEQRPALTVEAMERVRAAGVQVAVWKVEGLDDAAAAAHVARAAAGPLLVLGRGADAARVDGWLRVAAAQPGFAGFAIGRSIWWDAVQAWLAGELAPGAVADAVAERYLHAIEVWTAAAAVRAPS